MENKKQVAKQLLLEFKGENYIFGLDIFDQLGGEVSKLGKRGAFQIVAKVIYLCCK